MPDETVIERDFKSYENGLYQLIMNKGLFYLREYLLKMGMDKVRIAKNKESNYIPYFIYPFWEIYNFDEKKLSLAIYEFINKKKDEAYQKIDNDFEDMKKIIEPSFEKIQYILDKYFYDLTRYNQINETFAIQLKFIQSELRDITSALPNDIKEYYLKKKSSMRKIRSEIDKAEIQLSKLEKQIERAKNLESKEILEKRREELGITLEGNQNDLSQLVEELDDLDNLETYVESLTVEKERKGQKKKELEKVFKICSFCGTKNEDNRVNCKYCGRKLGKITEIEEKFSKVIVGKFCSNCGTEITSDFCEFCGNIQNLNIIKLNLAEIEDVDVIKEGIDIFGGIVSSSRKTWRKSTSGKKRDFKKTPKDFIIYDLMIEEEKIYSEFPKISELISPLLFNLELNGVKFSYVNTLEKNFIFTNSEHSIKIIEKYRKNRQTSNFSYQKNMINLQNKLYKNARRHTSKILKEIHKDLIKQLT